MTNRPLIKASGLCSFQINSGILILLLTVYPEETEAHLAPCVDCYEYIFDVPLKLYIEVISEQGSVHLKILAKN